ncbi:MAG: 30S ribosomal protein S16 [Candidatus Pacebacteria bacterium]|nr:30S ribosomal protein S16 [Candidatus Paceibacterota bacterium]
MLTIRYLRTGKKNQPFYRVVVTDKKNPPRGGRFLEILGFINPFTKEKQLNADRIKYWLSVGAKTSDTVHNLLVQEKVIEGVKINVRKKPKKKAVEAKAKTEATQAETAKPVEKASATEEKAPAIESKPAEEAPSETPVAEATPEPEVSTEVETK